MSLTELITPHLYLATSAWTAAAMLGSAVVGSATAIYGANKSAKAQAEANAANQAAQAEANRLNYQRWLESQGVGSDGKPVNTWLPRYATITSPNVEVPRGFSLFGKPKYGSASVGANGVVNGMQMAPGAGGAGPSGGGAGPSGDMGQMQMGGNTPYLNAAGNTMYEEDGLPYNPYQKS
jgi:hypothetical protein